MKIKRAVINIMLMLLWAGSSNAQQLPILGDLFGGLLGGGVQNLGGLGDFSGSVGRVLELGTVVLSNPQPLFQLGTDTGLPLVLGVAPVLEVLSTDPASLADFIIQGGTLLSPSLASLPAIPLLSAPLSGL